MDKCIVELQIRISKESIRIQKLREENGRLVKELCGYGIQYCHICMDVKCGDNINISKLEDEVADLTRQLNKREEDEKEVLKKEVEELKKELNIR